MSFALPAVKPKFDLGNVGPFSAGDPNFEVPDMLKNGFATVSQNTRTNCSLVHSERNFHKNRQHLNSVILRNTQGLHAPLRLNMELNSARKIGHLPFLPTHNAMLDSLTGRDIEIGPEDVFNTNEFPEIIGQPHAMVERQLALL